MDENIRKERVRLGLTIGQVATGIGVTPSLLRRWEEGKSEPLASDLRRMSEFYGCSPDRLLGLPERR